MNTRVVVVATHSANTLKSRIGLTLSGFVYEFFFINLQEAGFHFFIIQEGGRYPAGPGRVPRGRARYLEPIAHPPEPGAGLAPFEYGR